jgi:hypothetical protein
MSWILACTAADSTRATVLTWKNSHPLIQQYLRRDDVPNHLVNIFKYSMDEGIDNATVEFGDDPPGEYVFLGGRWVSRVKFKNARNWVKAIYLPFRVADTFAGAIPSAFDSFVFELSDYMLICEHRKVFFQTADVEFASNLRIIDSNVLLRNGDKYNTRSILQTTSETAHTEWLNDIIVNELHLYFLDAKDVYVSSLLFESIQTPYYKDNIHFNRKFRRYCDRPRQIIGCINVNASHWVSYCFDVNSMTLFYIDSYGVFVNVYDRKQILRVVGAILRKQIDACTVVNMTCKVQQDGSSCGYYAIWTAYVYSKQLHKTLDCRYFMPFEPMQRLSMSVRYFAHVLAHLPSQSKRTVEKCLGVASAAASAAAAARDASAAAVAAATA